MIYQKDNISNFIDNWFIKEGDIKLTGFFRAKVVDNVDPLKQNQIKVYIPELMKNVDGIWARPLYHFSTQAITPQIGDCVLVTFESGDLQKPVYIGHVRLSCPTSTSDKACGTIEDKVKLNIEDIPKDFWLLETPNKRYIRLSDALETIQIKSKTTQRLIEINDSSGKIEIKTPKCYIVLDDANSHIQAKVGNSYVTLTPSSIEAKVNNSKAYIDSSKIQLRSNVILLN